MKLMQSSPAAASRPTCEAWQQAGINFHMRTLNRQPLWNLTSINIFYHILAERPWTRALFCFRKSRNGLRARTGILCLSASVPTEQY